MRENKQLKGIRMKLLLLLMLLQDPSTNVHTDCITQGTPEIVIFSASAFAEIEINQPNNFFVQKPKYNATVDALYCGDDMEHWFDPAPKEILPL